MASNDKQSLFNYNVCSLIVLFRCYSLWKRIRWTTDFQGGWAS